MKRVCKKDRKLKRKGSFEHLVYGSVQHAEDKRRADILREPVFVEIGRREGKVIEGFPHDKKVCFNAIRNLIGTFNYADLDTFKNFMKSEAKDASYYTTTTGKISKKDGSRLKRTREGGGVRDWYINLPPWVSFYFADKVTEAGGITYVTKAISSLGADLVRELEKRTGYEVIGYACHPDSRGKIGLHFQYKTCSGGKALGRSSSGVRGRKGLRSLGDCNIALWQFNNLGVDIAFANKFEGDFDDKALINRMNKFLSDSLPPLDWEKIQEQAKLYARAWKDNRDIALENTPKKLKAKLAEVESDKKKLEREVSKAHDTVKQLEARLLTAETNANILREGSAESSSILSQTSEALSKAMEANAGLALALEAKVAEVRKVKEDRQKLREAIDVMRDEMTKKDVLIRKLQKDKGFGSGVSTPGTLDK